MKISDTAKFHIKFLSKSSLILVRVELRVYRIFRQGHNKNPWKLDAVFKRCNTISKELDC
jgi:hypothetical protein